MNNPPDDRSSPEGPLPRAARLLRHRAVLETLFANPGREFTVRELGVESRTSYATTWRLVEILRDLGALRAHRVGASHSLSVNPRSPVIPELRRLVTVRLLPHREAARRFARLVARVGGVRKVVLFGSAARGTVRRGSDVDVAVVLDRRADATMARVYEAAARVQDETGLKVVPIGVVPRELDGDTKIARALKDGDVLYERP